MRLNTLKPAPGANRARKRVGRGIAAGKGVPMTLTARVRAEGRSGIRRIRIRDFQVISDSEAKNDRRMTRMRTPFLKQKLRHPSLLYTGEKTNE